MRSGFQRDLLSLEHAVLTLGSMAATAVETSMSALSLRSGTLAQAVIDGDSELDERVRIIEELGLLLIATQQPMAGDLRTILAALRIAEELERIGDYAEGIGKVALRNLDEIPLPTDCPVTEVFRMSELVMTMLRDSMAAFVDRDLATARRIWNDDDVIDELQRAIYDDIQSAMRREPAIITGATRYLWVVHNLERIADRVTNICERITSMVTGERAQLKLMTGQASS